MIWKTGRRHAILFRSTTVDQVTSDPRGGGIDIARQGLDSGGSPARLAWRDLVAGEHGVGGGKIWQAAEDIAGGR